MHDNDLLNLYSFDSNDNSQSLQVSPLEPIILDYEILTIEQLAIQINQPSAQITSAEKSEDFPFEEYFNSNMLGSTEDNTGISKTDTALEKDKLSKIAQNLVPILPALQNKKKQTIKFHYQDEKKHLYNGKSFFKIVTQQIPSNDSLSMLFENLQRSLHNSASPSSLPSLHNQDILFNQTPSNSSSTIQNSPSRKRKQSDFNVTSYKFIIENSNGSNHKPREVGFQIIDETEEICKKYRKYK